MKILRACYLILIRVPGLRRFLVPIKNFYRRNRLNQQDEYFEGRLVILEALVQGLDERLSELENKK
jgi:hypothetical protein